MTYTWLPPSGGRSNPVRWRLNRRFRCLPWIRPAAALEAADGAHGHVVIALDLARQAHAGQSFLLHPRFFGFCHTTGLAAHELHAAGGAARVATARVQHVNPGVLFDGEDESFS